MKKTVKKWFWAWQSEEEEQWLNDMAAEGFHLISVGFGTYLFEEGEPGQYQYRLEMLDNVPTHTKSRKYIDFLEETGIEYIGAINRWAYFRKRTEEGPFDLFSDVDSRLTHFNRVLVLLIAVTLPVLCTGAANFHIGLTYGGPVNLVLSFLLLIMGALLVYGIVRIYRKMRYLKKERMIRE